jgi:hypothetical protein
VLERERHMIQNPFLAIGGSNIQIELLVLQPNWEHKNKQTY